MKKKLVLWAHDDKDQKLLLGLELNEKDNKVLLHKIKEEDATQDIYTKMMDDWREGKEFEFPTNTVVDERELSLTEDLLPVDIKTDRTDVVARAKAEWHFVVLSSKLYDMYNTEVEELKEKVHNLTQYDDGIWNDMKSFWTKVQNQVQDRNLFREHANNLRKETNSLFDRMKELKDDLQREFLLQSKKSTEEFNGLLDTIQEKLDKNLGLKPIFEDLKGIQNKFRKAQFTRDDRNEIWKRLDAYFKIVKDKKYGGQGGDSSPLSRVQRRYDGLLAAITKMEGSINWDKKDLERQQRRIDQTDGQLERELGKAKIIMIQERINSKQEKLDDMLKTKEMLEKKIEKEKRNEEKRAKRAEVDAAKEAAKAKIAEEMQAAAETRDEAKLESKANEIKEGKKPIEKAAEAVVSAETVVTPPATEDKKEEE